MEMNDLHVSTFGYEEEIRVRFSKTVQIRQYEPETLEYESTIKVNKPLRGIDRVVIAELAKSELIYSCHLALLSRRIIEKEQFVNVVKCLEEEINALDIKYKKITGTDMKETLMLRYEYEAPVLNADVAEESTDAEVNGDEVNGAVVE